MLTPTSAETSRVRSPSKPRPAISWYAARIRAPRRSSLLATGPAVLLAGLITDSIKHLIEKRGAMRRASRSELGHTTACHREALPPADERLYGAPFGRSTANVPNSRP